MKHTKVWVGRRPDSVESCKLMQTIHADICLCERLGLLHQWSRPFWRINSPEPRTLSSSTFHHISLLFASLTIHCSKRAVSFLLRSFASRRSSFQKITLFFVLSKRCPDLPHFENITILEVLKTDKFYRGIEISFFRFC